MTVRPPRYIAPRRVQQAFTGNGRIARVTDTSRLVSGVLGVRGLPDREVLTVVDPDAVAAALARDDCTRFGGTPLMLVGGDGLFGIAFGPPEPPASQVSCLAHAVEINEHGATVMLGGDEAGPDWLLFEYTDDEESD